MSSCYLLVASKLRIQIFVYPQSIIGKLRIKENHFYENKNIPGSSFSIINCYKIECTAGSVSTDEILKEAYQLAAKQNKKVFIIFHASWCGWCHRMDSSLNDKTCRQFFDDNFVIWHLVVYESKGKKDLENPGALELLTRNNGNDKGIPYWLVFDKDGNLLADSKMRGEGAGLDNEGNNSGCPASKEEVNHFINMLKKTTTLNKEALEIIEKRFRQNEQK